jgi:RNA recognition motif-containing protein
MKIFVGGLLQDVTNERIEKAFGVYGKVTSATVVKHHPSGAPRGFAYVDMPISAEATAAIAALNGRARMGSSLEVHEICIPGPRLRHHRPASRFSPGGTRRQAPQVPVPAK